jgi:Cof subfamily protein (haloacid dehalogenase superfamily)
MLKPLPYRALALDLDGTLLDSQGILTDATASLLRVLSSRGLRLILASGRMTARVLPFAEQLGVPVDLVTYNGSEVLTHGPMGWTALSSRGLSNLSRDAVYALSRSHSVFLNVYARNKLHGYHPQGDFTWSKHYETSSGATYAGKHTRLPDLPMEGIQKLLVIGTPAERDHLHDAWSPLLSDHCVLTKSNPEYLEFLAKDVSKGTGLRIWLDHNGLAASDLLAFGDAENDVEMLRLAGLGIAMANATPGLRADYGRSFRNGGSSGDGRSSGRFSSWTNAQAGVARELAGIFGLPLP